MSVFVAAAEHESFADAGRKLRMSAALVSNRIARLEERLGVRLFNRTTRRIQLTDAGKRYYEDCVDILRRMVEAEERLSEDHKAPTGVLRISTSIAFGQHHLARMAGKFQREVPGVRLQVQATDRLADVLGEGLDLVIREGPLVDTSLKARILGPSTRFIYASPNYLVKFGEPWTPQDLLDHNCLLLRFPGSRQFRWRFHGGDGHYDLPLSGSLDSSSGEILTRWALDGFGLVLKPYWEVSEEVEAGRLVPVLQDHMPKDEFLHVLYPYEHFVPPKVRAFIDFLVNETAADSAWRATPPV